jgi:hypothetical protein
MHSCPFRDLADEINQRVIKQRFDPTLEVHLVDRIYLGRNTERASRSAGELDRGVDAFLRNDATEKSEIPGNAMPKPV